MQENKYDQLVFTEAGQGQSWPIKYKLKWPENIFTCQIIEGMLDSVLSEARAGERVLLYAVGEVICHISEWHFDTRDLLRGRLGGINKGLHVNRFIRELFII